MRCTPDSCRVPDRCRAPKQLQSIQCRILSGCPKSCIRTAPLPYVVHCRNTPSITQAPLAQKAISLYSVPFLSTCPKSYTFEILGCLQAVTPLLKFMPQFHSVTPLICSGSQETGQAGASGESQPWVPKGQGETQAARPNRKQLRQAAVANRFAETLRQKDREKSVTCRKRERNSNSAFTRTFPFP